MTNYNSNVDDYDMYYISQTEHALCVAPDKDSEVIWLPKSQIEFEDKNYKQYGIVRVTIPDWLAEKKGLA